MIRPLVDQAHPKSFCKISTSPIFGAQKSQPVSQQEFTTLTDKRCIMDSTIHDESVVELHITQQVY
jgi:hypothetical protein